MQRVGTLRLSARVVAGVRVRGVHSLRKLPYPVEGGLGAFLPPDALRTVGVEYQQGLLDRLNDYTRTHDKLKNSSVAQIVIETAASREDTQAFAWASHALNNSFFLEHLKPPSATEPTHEDAMSDVLRLAVKQQLGGLEMLKAAVAGTAAGMAGSGHVWLVSDEKGQLAVLPTFAAGTLLVRERRATPLEIPGSDVTRTNVAPAPAPGAGAYFAAPRPAAGAPAGARALSTSAPAPAQDSLYGGGRPAAANVYGGSAAADAELQSRVAANMAAGGTAAHDARKLSALWPLFCVSVHERNWLAAGLGVWGQERWLAQFWPVLDWARVSRRYDELTHDARARMQSNL